MASPVLNNTSRPRAGDIAEQNRSSKGGLMRAAMDAGVNFSRYLEQVDPSDPEDYGADNLLDAFGRQLKLVGIRTVSDPAAGVWADEFGAFDKDEHTRTLGLEWCCRRHREARFGRTANPLVGGAVRTIGNRAVFTAQDEGLGTIFRPYFDAAEERASRLTPALPLARIVALTTPIDTDSYRAAYMTEPDADEIRMVRVAELGEIPLAHITAGEHAITIHKYARGYEISYEAQRRTRIDKVAFWIQRNAIQQENDKLEHATDVLINGDGNANAATAYDLTTLDSGTTANNVTLRSWLAFKDTFNNDYAMDVALMQSGLKITLQLLNAGNANIPLIALPQFGGFTELNNRLGEGTALGSLASIPAGRIVGIDTSSALEHVMEVGAEISETMKFVTRQSDVVVMSEVEGFAVLDQKATRVLNTTA